MLQLLPSWRQSWVSVVHKLNFGFSSDTNSYRGTVGRDDSEGPQLDMGPGRCHTYIFTESEPLLSCSSNAPATSSLTSINRFGSYLSTYTDGYWNNIYYSTCLNNARVSLIFIGQQMQFVIHIVFSWSREPLQVWNTITYFTDRQSFPKSKALIYHCENFSFLQKNGFFILSDNNFDHWQRVEPGLLNFREMRGCAVCMRSERNTSFYYDMKEARWR